MQKPTHLLLSDQKQKVALIRAYKNGRTDIVFRGISATSYSPALQNDLLSGHYKSALGYLFAAPPGYLPEGYEIVPITQKDEGK